MVKVLDKALDLLIEVILSDPDYQICLKLRENMVHNVKVMDLIDNLKCMQKKYVKSGYSKDIKKNLDSLTEQLYQIPLYASYMMHLEKVNDMLSYVESELNHYFYELLN